MQECFSKHSRMGTARMETRQTAKERTKRGRSMERSKAGTKKRSPDALTIARATAQGSLRPQAVDD